MAIKELKITPIVSAPGMSFGERAKAMVHGQNKFLSPNTVQGAANPQVPGGPAEVQAVQAQQQKTSAVAKPKAMPHNPLQGRLFKGASEMTKQQLKIAGLIKLARCKAKLCKMKKKATLLSPVATAGARIGEAAGGVGRAVSKPLSKLLKLVGANETSNHMATNRVLSSRAGSLTPGGSKAVTDAEKSMRHLGAGAVGAGAAGAGLAVGLPFAHKKHKAKKEQKEKEANDKQAGIKDFILPILAALGAGAVIPPAFGGLRSLATKAFDPNTYIPPKTEDVSRFGGIGPSDESAHRRAIAQRGAIESQTQGLLNGYQSAAAKQACFMGLCKGIALSDEEMQKFASTLPKGTDVKKAYLEKIALLPPWLSGIWNAIKPYAVPAALAIGGSAVIPPAIGGLHSFARKLFDPGTYTMPKTEDLSRYGGLSPADEGAFNRTIAQRSAVQSQMQSLLNGYSRAARPESYGG
jgi:hypothetical protein